MFRIFALVIVLLAGGVANASDEIRTEVVKFPAGASGTSIEGQIQGYASVAYVLEARAGQVMKVKMKTPHLSTYFNVYGPGKGPGDEALAVSEMVGPMVNDINDFEGVLPADGDYTISVYMYRSAARRNETADYTLDVSIAAPN